MQKKAVRQRLCVWVAFRVARLAGAAAGSNGYTLAKYRFGGDGRHMRHLASPSVSVKLARGLCVFHQVYSEVFICSPILALASMCFAHSALLVLGPCCTFPAVHMAKRGPILWSWRNQDKPSRLMFHPHLTRPMKSAREHNSFPTGTTQPSALQARATSRGPHKFHVGTPQPLSMFG